MNDLTVLARSIQAELKRVGCDPGSIDGHWGPNAMNALRAFNRAANTALSVDAPTEDTLKSRP
jgi:peptidoglycan hydrolase-like protein with peptidoglycan-binding domain